MKLLTIIMLLGLAACGSGGPSPQKLDDMLNPPPPPTQPTPPLQETPVPAPISYIQWTIEDNGDKTLEFDGYTYILEYSSGGARIDIDEEQMWRTASLYFNHNNEDPFDSLEFSNIRELLSHQMDYVVENNKVFTERGLETGGSNTTPHQIRPPNEDIKGFSAWFVDYDPFLKYWGASYKLNDTYTIVARSFRQYYLLHGQRVYYMQRNVKIEITNVDGTMDIWRLGGNTMNAQYSWNVVLDNAQTKLNDFLSTRGGTIVTLSKTSVTQQ